MTGEISGGQPVYAEPMVGRGAYEGLRWWSGPLTATDLDEGVGEPWGRWAKASSPDGEVVAFGDTITLSAEVKNTVPLKELRFTAYYPGWPRAKSAGRLDGFSETRTWRILAVCRPPGVGGEPKKTNACRVGRYGHRRGRDLRVGPDPAGQREGHPLAAAHHRRDHREVRRLCAGDPLVRRLRRGRLPAQRPRWCEEGQEVPQGRGLDRHLLRLGKTGRAQRSSLVFDAEKKTRQQDRWAYLLPPQPPAAPGNVVEKVVSTRNIPETDGFIDRVRVTWGDVSGEAGYRVYRRDFFLEIGPNARGRDCWSIGVGRPELLATVPADTTVFRYRYSYEGSPFNLGPQFLVTAFNQVGEATGTSREPTRTPSIEGIPRCK